ncbi:VOC family protein [Alkalibacterium sp. 20]|uniref:VOC family protein n=1 Tax=Alkalibacterium sp. 20 TaxID=1798803 RepID=UPI0008FFF043|nr:VOC family protein [Alkalibacterium sp. 20]OJF93596.1 glyoxalase [Alkalibacterium sp. 20]
MELGAFSVSLNVKDLNASEEFYVKIGLKVFAGEIDQNYLIMKNGDAVIGLFQNMIDENILTFNPGWDQSSKKLTDYSDVREIYEDVKVQKIPTEQELLDGEKGPGSFFMTDPDGNSILIDQHI